jgi:glutamate 5-kinase
MARVKKRVVFKFGTGILTNPKGTLDRAQIRRLADEVCAAVTQGHECIIVSSGAIGAGVGALGLAGRPEDISTRQLCAAIGQTLLMQAYHASFARHGIHAAQILLTHSDLDSRTRSQNASHTLERLFKQGRIIPVINENDVVAVDEIRQLRIGDNDQLSVDVAMLANAKLLVLLTSVDGVLDSSTAPPRVVRTLKRGADALPLVRNEKGSLSVGGMASKLQAADRAADGGISVVIANGRKKGELAAILSGKPAGTMIRAR